MEIKNMTFGGTKDSEKLLTSSFFRKGAIFPIVSTVTGLTSVVCGVALIAFNILKIITFSFIALGQTFTKKEVTAKEIIDDSIVAIIENLVFGVGLGLYESIPVIGNIASWIKLSK